MKLLISLLYALSGTNTQKNLKSIAFLSVIVRIELNIKRRTGVNSHYALLYFILYS